MLPPFHGTKVKRQPPLARPIGTRGGPNVVATTSRGPFVNRKKSPFRIALGEPQAALRLARTYSDQKQGTKGRKRNRYPSPVPHGGRREPTMGQPPIAMLFVEGAGNAAPERATSALRAQRRAQTYH